MALASSVMGWSIGRVVYVYDYNVQLVNTIPNAHTLSFPEGKLVIKSNGENYEYPLQEVGNMIVSFDATDAYDNVANEIYGVTLSFANGVVCISAPENIRRFEVFTPVGQILTSSEPNATVASVKVNIRTSILLVKVEL